jgi:hypothetical protein
MYVYIFLLSRKDIIFEMMRLDNSLNVNEDLDPKEIIRVAEPKLFVLAPAPSQTFNKFRLLSRL